MIDPDAFLQLNDDEAERRERRSDVSIQSNDQSLASDNANLKRCLQMYTDNVSNKIWVVQTVQKLKFNFDSITENHKRKCLECNSDRQLL